MTDPDQPTDDSGIDGGFDRRRLLQALGAGVGLSAISGVGQARIAGRTPVSPPSGVQLQQGSGDSIHPVYGFSAPSPEVSPPVEPDHEVQALIRERENAPVPAFYFEPTGLAIEPGDTVQFTMATPHHNVVAFHPGFGYLQRVPDSVPPFSGPMLPAGGYWLYTFEQEGVYEMNCAPHEIFGMVMRIVAGSASGPAAEPLPDLCARPEGSGEDGGGEGGGPPLRTPGFTAYTVLTDPALAPDTILDAGSVAWDDLAAESKQVFVRPVGFPPCADDSGQSSGGGGGGGGGSDSETTAEGGNGKAKQGG